MGNLRGWLQRFVDHNTAMHQHHEQMQELIGNIKTLNRIIKTKVVLIEQSIPELVRNLEDINRKLDTAIGLLTDIEIDTSH